MCIRDSFEEAVAGWVPRRESCFVCEYTTGVYGRTGSLFESGGWSEAFFVVEAGEGRAESKLFVRRAQGAGALHDEADGPRSKQCPAQVRSTVRPCSMSKCAVRCDMVCSSARGRIKARGRWASNGGAADGGESK